MKIISTVPSQTELLYDLGMEEEVVGITKFCVFPEVWFRTKEKIGGTKNLDIQKIRNLSPDWIFSNKEENIKEQIEALFPFSKHYTSDVHHLESAISMIERIGTYTDTLSKAKEIIHQINEGFQTLHHNFPSKKVLYLIWKNPYMSIGRDTFIHDMLQKCNFDNVCKTEVRYPIVSIETIKNLSPDCIFLSSEPYPFQEKHINELQQILPNTLILLVDGTYFSWYGSRLMHAPAYFTNVINQVHNA